MRAVIIGDSVSATIAGDGDRAGQRECELGKQRAGQPAWKPIGTYTATSTTVIAIIGPPELARGDAATACSGALPLLHVPVDVLDHDDRIVDDQADRQHQREQRQQVDRIARAASMTKKVPIER